MGGFLELESYMMSNFKAYFPRTLGKFQKGQKLPGLHPNTDIHETNWFNYCFYCPLFWLEPMRQVVLWVFGDSFPISRASVGKAIFCSVHCGRALCQGPGVDAPWRNAAEGARKEVARGRGRESARANRQTDGLVSSPCLKDQV